MAKKLRPDWVLFVITLSLVIFGVVMVFSSSVVLATTDHHGDANYFSFKQIMAAVIGLALMFIVMKVDYHVYRKPAVVFTLLSMAVALLVIVFFFAKARNTHRWIQLPHFSFQPSELAKLAVIFFLAYFLEKRKGQINNVQFTLAPVAIIVGLLSALIVSEPDLGTAVALLITCLVLLFVAGLDLRWFALPAALSVPVFYYLVYLTPWRWDRIMAFLHPDADPKGAGYHINQSLLSVGSGGIFGLGYMEGKNKLFFLPDGHTDFIFAVVGEELGLIGACAVLLLFLVFLWRGLRTSAKAPDMFGFYLALGITMMVSVQAFINMSVVLALVPTKGIPLPFLSYGGSSFVVMLAAVGILLNVSQQSS
jgi:cell division protein FtsW